MNKTKTNISMFKKFSNFFFEEENVSARKKIFSSLWALVIGILIASIFISSLGSNPFQVYSEIVRSSLSQYFVYKFLIIISVFIFSSVAVGVGFKSSMFNIGIPGQMMASGIVSIVVMSYLGAITENTIEVTAISMLVGFLAGILSALLVGLIAGLLKAYFNINEVITTILLNWIVFYISKQLLNGTNGYRFETPSGSVDRPTTKQIVFSNSFFTTTGFAILIVVMAIIFAVLVWFIIKKTSIGYKIKMTGFNKNASKYSGTNEKTLIISIMAISGLLAGIAGFLWYTYSQNKMSIDISPEPIGFDSIAISLLAFNSPIGIIFTSIFYAFLTTGSNTLQLINPKLDAQAVQMISGIIIYLAAISVVFTKIRPIQKVFKVYFLYKSKIFFRETKEIEEYLKTRKNIVKLIKTTKDEAQKVLWKERLVVLDKHIKHLKEKHFNKETLLEKEQKNYKNHLNDFITNYQFNENLNKTNDIKYLEKILLINTQFINKLQLLSKEHKVSIFKAYWISKKIMAKNNKLSIKVIKLSNKENEPLWKELKESLKADFFKKSLNNKEMTDEQKVELFKEISDKRREVNKQLSESGFYDLKVWKDQYKANKIELKSNYNKEKEMIVSNIKKDYQWLKMEVN